MDVFQQLEAMRKRILQEIYTEFDAFAECLREQMSEGIDPCAYALPYDMQYPLTAGAGIFKGKKTTSAVIEGETVELRTWRQLVEEIMKRCMADPKYRNALYRQAGKVSGRKRALLANSGKGMRSPMLLGENLYLETHYDTETLLNILMIRILRPIGYDFSSILVTVRNG